MRDRIHRKSGDGSAQDSSHAGTPGRSTLVERVYRKAKGGGGAPDAGATFDQATSGGGGQIPYRGEMERAFGQSFEGVQSYTGRGDEMQALGATAAASGEKVAFGTSTPDRA